MSLLYLDCFAGLAGDMMLGLLLDLGLSLDDLRADLATVSLSGYRLEAERVTKQGIAATKLHVVVGDDPHAAEQAHLHVHDPDEHQDDAPHGPVSHAHDSHTHSHEDHGASLHLADIERLITESGLPGRTQDRARAIFRALGEAEARVHGVPIGHVHFHEVGAIDSIVDIVGTAIGLERLGIDRIEAGPVHVGSGFVEVAHGRMPVPAPATAELLRGIPTYATDVQGELVTPTGAAILRACADTFGAQPPMRTDRVGYGAGSRDYSPLPNCVRGSLGVPAAAEPATYGGATGSGYAAGPEADSGRGGSKNAGPGSGGATDEVLVLETMVDDMLPEHLGYALEQLLAAGALDVFFTSVQGKKSRPATLVTVLARDDTVDRVTQVLFAETTTFGIRRRREQRVILDREFLTVDTAWGPVPVKVGRQNGAVLTVAPEYEECKRLAQASGAALRTVYDQAKQAAHARLQA